MWIHLNTDSAEAAALGTSGQGGLRYTTQTIRTRESPMRTRGVLFRCVIRDEERKNAHYPRIVAAPLVHRATTRATTTTAALYSRLLFRSAPSTVDFDSRFRCRAIRHCEWLLWAISLVAADKNFLRWNRTYTRRSAVIKDHKWFLFLEMIMNFSFYCDANIEYTRFLMYWWLWLKLRTDQS